ncbi:MAG: DUF4159 domain-containing protein [Alphaproteobacteria bacterium]
MWGSFTFAAPYMLAFLMALPLLWWLLRLTPPSPQRVVFPALSLLRDLVTQEQTPKRTPWWLLLLRFLTLILLILAFAQPVINPQATTTGKGTLLIAIDNDWAAARDWDTRQKALQALIKQAERDNREAALLTTAPSSDGSPLQIIGPMAAKALYAEAERIKPMPWPSQWGEAKNLLAQINFKESIWLSSGLGGVDAKIFYAGLKDASEVRVLSDAERPIYLLQPPTTDGEDLSIGVLRAAQSDAATIAIAAVARDGHILSHFATSFAPGSPRATTPITMPLDIRNQVTRFVIEGQHSAAMTVVLDASWEHRPVGLIGDKSDIAQHSLLNGLYYIDRALDPYADLHVGSLDELLDKKMSVLVLTDNTELRQNQIAPLTHWIKQGGVLVRFAGEHLATEQKAEQSELLPVIVRTGDRAMGGSLSWTTPQKLREFSTTSPFRGLPIPEDVTINRQILAEPSADLAQRNWASLIDGTPLVTAKNISRGMSILFHVPPKSDWSNLPLSGLFVDMLRRIVDLSHGVNADTHFTSLPPLRMLDAFGNDVKPDRAAQPITDNDFSHITPSPKHPPGIYGGDTMNRAFNLGTALPNPDVLKDITTEPYQQKADESDLMPLLLAIVFTLLLIDMLISLWLRGILTVGRKTMAAVLLFVFFLSPAYAASDPNSPIELTSRTTLAYIQTGDRETDRISELGLTSLARMLQHRTSIDDIGVAGLNPNTDELSFFPLIYWPILPHQAPLSEEGAQRINTYLHHGGMVLIDTLNGEKASPILLQATLGNIDMPPLLKLPQDHVLKRSFFLLNDFPGRYNNPDFWLEPEDASSNDGVATVLMGNNGWAAAWALDERGNPLFPCTPGGELQREQAFRFGINIVMYALTGNYKSDQLHAQELLKRMGK